MAQPSKRKTLRVKFNKDVDSGPLPADADSTMQQTIQDERVRRQIRSHTVPKPSYRKPK